MRCRTSRRGSSGWRSAPALLVCGLFALLSLVASPSLAARTLSESEQTALLESLTVADAILTELEQRSATQRAHSAELATRLEQAQQQLSTLDATLRLWQDHSAELEGSLESSSSALGKLRSSLDELTTRYVALLRSWSGYRAEMLKQAELRELVVRRWRTVAIAGTIGAIAGGFLAGLLAGK